MDNILTYLFGPLFSVLPKRWRELLPFSKRVHWGRAAIVSGFLELMAAIVAASYWYMYGMTAWVDHAVDAALHGKLGPGVTPQQIGSVALVIWVTHPLTLLLTYVGIEGAVRLSGAAFTDSILGTFPLFLFDKLLFSPFRRRLPEDNYAATHSSKTISFGGTIRERMAAAVLPSLSDELCFKKNASGEILEIHASRRKQNWTPPRVVRYQDHYYRLEADSLGGGARPFHYTLRLLPKGVPGRTVLLYSPSDVVIREQR
jgi:hypothetical protein